jgi:Fur family transcriptional regulator, peroxide stress response regulator
MVGGINNHLTNRNNSYIVIYMNERIDFQNRCRNGKLKITPQRSAIYASLTNDRSHPFADTIFNRVKGNIPNISFDTVNRTLVSFVDLGLLKAVEGFGRPKRFDPDLSAHHHFQCTKCHKIVDFCDKRLNNLPVPREIENKFTVTGKKVLIEGICDYCRNRPGKSKNKTERRKNGN